MKEIKNEINIFNESAVFDYVTEQMSKETRAEFERILESDKVLQKMVKEEKLLRVQLLEIDQTQSSASPISDSNIDKLFASINELDTTNPTLHTKSRTNKVWFGAGAIAASTILAVALLLNGQTNQTAPQYNLLSVQPAKEDIDFNELVEGNKVAQIWLDSPDNNEVILDAFNKYNLTPIGRAGEAWIVTSKQALSPLQLSALRAEKEFKRISLISYDNEE